MWSLFLEENFIFQLLITLLQSYNNLADMAIHFAPPPQLVPFPCPFSIVHSCFGFIPTKPFFHFGPVPHSFLDSLLASPRRMVWFSVLWSRVPFWNTSIYLYLVLSRGQMKQLWNTGSDFRICGLSSWPCHIPPVWSQDGLNSLHWLSYPYKKDINSCLKVKVDNILEKFIKSSKRYPKIVFP